MNVTATDVTVTIGENEIVQHINLHIRKHEFVGLLGPNGSGKSTLLKSIYRTLKPKVGWISLNEQNIYQLSALESARQMAVVRQESAIEFDFTVQEMVMMGRFPHQSFFQADTKQDKRLVSEALSRVGLQGFENRSFMTLSGGEKQRVLIARALAQQAGMLVLDEPTNHLDIHSQLQIMDILKKLKCTVLAAIHDLNIAAAFCDRIYIIQSGQIVAEGRPEHVLSPDLLHDVFGVECEVSIHPETARPYIVFLSAVYHE